MRPICSDGYLVGLAPATQTVRDTVPRIFSTRMPDVLACECFAFFDYRDHLVFSATCVRLRALIRSSPRARPAAVSLETCQDDKALAFPSVVWCMAQIAPRTLILSERAPLSPVLLHRLLFQVPSLERLTCALADKSDLDEAFKFGGLPTQPMASDGKLPTQPMASDGKLPSQPMAQLVALTMMDNKTCDFRVFLTSLDDFCPLLPALVSLDLWSRNLANISASQLRVLARALPTLTSFLCTCAFWDRPLAHPLLNGDRIWPGLTRLTASVFSSSVDLSWFAQLAAPKSLYLTIVGPGEPTLDALAALSSLSLLKLHCASAKSPAWLAPLARLAALTSLDLNFAPGGVVLPPLPALGILTLGLNAGLLLARLPDLYPALTDLRLLHSDDFDAEQHGALTRLTALERLAFKASHMPTSWLVELVRHLPRLCALDLPWDCALGEADDPDSARAAFDVRRIAITGILLREAPDDGVEEAVDPEDDGRESGSEDDEPQETFVAPAAEIEVEDIDDPDYVPPDPK